MQSTGRTQHCTVKQLPCHLVGNVRTIQTLALTSSGPDVTVHKFINSLLERSCLIVIGSSNSLELFLAMNETGVLK